MPAPYSVLSCGHLLNPDDCGAGSRAICFAAPRRDVAAVTDSVRLPDGRVLAYEEYGIRPASRS